MCVTKYCAKLGRSVGTQCPFSAFSKSIKIKKNKHGVPTERSSRHSIFVTHIWFLRNFFVYSNKNRQE